MKKSIYWKFEGKRFMGYAELEKESRTIALRNSKGDAFSILEEEDIENGMSLEEIFESIPMDVTDFEL